MASVQETSSGPDRPTISIDYNKPEAIYNNGDIVEGYVVIHNTQEITIKNISVHCKGQAKFNSNNGQENEMLLTRAQISNSETYFDLMQTVLISSDVNNGVTTIQPGNHRYNFRFQVPEEIPSTFVAPIGSVDYSCNVIVQLPGSNSSNNYQYERPFVIVSRIDINTVTNATAPLGLIKKKKFRSLIFIPAGSIKVTVLLNQKAYVLGDEIKMNILIENKYRPIHVFEVYLRRVIAYSDNTGNLTGNILPPLTGVKFDCSLPSGKTSVNDAEIAIPSDMPPTHLGRGCNIMEIGYFLEVALWCDKEPKKPPVFHFVIPIFVGTQNDSQQTTRRTPTMPRSGNATPPPSYDTLDFPAK